MATDLSGKVKAICRQNYKSNCHNCELRPKCVSKIGPGSVGFEKWVAELNEWGEQIERY